jgi:hypothetical protein
MTFGDRGGDLNLLRRSAVSPDEPKSVSAVTPFTACRRES